MLVERDLRAAWPLTEPEYRRRLVAAWLRDPMRPGLVEALSAEEPDEHPEWARFADAQLREVGRVCRYVDLSGSGWASRPQAESPGCELVLLAEAAELNGLEEPPSLPAYALLMRHDPEQGWRVAELR